MKLVHLVFCLFLAGCVTAKAADPQASQRKLDEYRADNGVLSKIIQSNADKSRAMLTCSGKVYSVKRTGYEIVAPVVFPEQNKHPQSGGWYEYVDIKLCSDSMKTKYLIKANKGKEPSIIAYLPGDTKADPILQRDAAKHALAAASVNGIDPNCKRMNVIDTKFISEESMGAWTEDWTVSACGKKVVRMRFIPSVIGGTSIKATVK